MKITEMIENVWEIQWVSRKIDFHFFSFFFLLITVGSFFIKKNMMKGPILIKIAQMIEFVWEIQWVSRKIDFYFFFIFFKDIKISIFFTTKNKIFDFFISQQKI